MSAPHREAKKNYIGILNHRERAPVNDTLVESDRPVKDYLLGLMTAVLNRNTDAGEPVSSPTLPSRPDQPSID
jgi:hypothetical protein